MKNLFPILAIIALSSNPAFAQSAPAFLQFDGSGTVCAKWAGQRPANVTVYDWTPALKADGSQDLDERNYKLQLGAVVYAPAVVPQKPDMGAFKDGIWADTTIPAAAKLQLTIFFPVLESYLQQPAKIQTAWAAICGTAPWMTPEIKATVEAVAAAAHVPITP